ncbi:MAG: ATP-binding protein [Prolixibacteraceae bacterium]
MDRKDSRQYMEMAIEAMHASIPEPRSDKKVSPLVGSVLIKPDGTTQTASRGELRYGDHAEFTLLERKNRSEKLDGCILFATLEPCAPGSRRHPKLGCAERIVNARIKEVWIGIEDPDPTVDRKGIKYLEENGITVHLFDRDLQQEIEDANADFLKQANERKEEAEKKDIVLTVLENAEPKADYTDLSIDVLDKYRDKIGMKSDIHSDEFKRKLWRKGVLQKTDNIFLPSGLGLLLFGKSPEDFHPQSIIKATVRYPGGKTEIRDFKGPIINIPNLIEEWWYKVMPHSIDRSSTKRQRESEFPYEPIREAIVNAIVHRDYDIVGASIHLDITPDFISIKSPGGPVSPLTLSDLNRFNAPSLSRNPVLFSIFAEFEMVERRGFGMETWSTLPQKYNLPIPEYSFKEPFLQIQFATSFESKKMLLDEEIRKKLSDEEFAGYEFVKSKELVTKKEYIDAFGFNDKKAQRHLAKFRDLGLVIIEGAGPSSAYRVAGVD